MKITCGTDIIEISRIEQAIEKNGERFLKHIFTDNEIAYCESHKNQKYQHYAARFAAKEAAFKAVGEQMDKTKINWRTFEVVKLEDGKPDIKINYEMSDLQSLAISISHCKEYATANAVAIFK